MKNISHEEFYKETDQSFEKHLNIESNFENETILKTRAVLHQEQEHQKHPRIPHDINRFKKPFENTRDSSTHHLKTFESKSKKTKLYFISSIAEYF